RVAAGSGSGGGVASAEASPTDQEASPEVSTDGPVTRPARTCWLICPRTASGRAPPDSPGAAAAEEAAIVIANDDDATVRTPRRAWSLVRVSPVSGVAGRTGARCRPRACVVSSDNEPLPLLTACGGELSGAGRSSPTRDRAAHSPVFPAGNRGSPSLPTDLSHRLRRRRQGAASAVGDSTARVTVERSRR